MFLPVVIRKGILSKLYPAGCVGQVILVIDTAFNLRRQQLGYNLDLLHQLKSTVGSRIITISFINLGIHFSWIPFDIKLKYFILRGLNLPFAHQSRVQIATLHKCILLRTQRRNFKLESSVLQ